MMQKESNFEEIVADGYFWILGSHPGEEMIRWQSEVINPKTPEEVRRRFMLSLMNSLPKSNTDISEVLHKGRSALLREVPKGVDTFLSAGCAGLWFFEWIERCYGKPRVHIGLEYYAKKPDGLPEYVKWIENTCSDMSGVETGSCDIVFSGQNYEHLWPDELLGFMLEAARVTKEGGLLVMDSPNRTATEVLRNWSHPEHTVEATLEEAERVMTLAGFEITARKGVWLMRDPATGQVLPLQPVDTDCWTVAERLIAAKDNPNDAFIWWLEGRRTSRMPDREQLCNTINDIFDRAWPERLTRFSTDIGLLEQRGREEWLVADADKRGALLFGPFFPLRANRYECDFEVEIFEGEGAEVDATCEVLIGRSKTPIASQAVFGPPGKRKVTINFDLHQLEFGVQFRIIAWGARKIACRKFVNIRTAHESMP